MGDYDEPYGLEYVDDEYISTADLNEIIYYEKLDADREQATLEAEGNRWWKNQKKVDALISAGDYHNAALLCWHSGGCMLTGSCAADDPRYGQEGMRCSNCGAHVTDIGGTVINTR